MLHFVPCSDILPSQRNLDSVEIVFNEYADMAGQWKINTHWLRASAMTRVKSPVAAPLSFHIRKEKLRAKVWTL